MVSAGSPSRTLWLLAAAMLALAAHLANGAEPSAGRYYGEFQPPMPLRHYPQQGQQAPSDWRFRPDQGNHAQGTPPQPMPSGWSGQPMGPPWSGGWQSPYPPGAQPPGLSGGPGSLAGAPPEVEVTLSSNPAYVRQSLILKLRLISQGGLSTVNTNLTGVPDVQAELLEGPVSRMQQGASGAEQVNDYFYLLRPLRAGPLAIAPVKVTATNTRGRRFEIEAKSAPTLEVRPAPAQVRPWLPLTGLSLSAHLDPNAEIAPGRPLSLTLELHAEGGSADQLPSLEPLLRSANFRSYRESTRIQTHLDSAGQRLLAERAEVFTLVPQSDKPLWLPKMDLAWWNLTTDQADIASLPARRLDGEADAADQRMQQEAESSGLSSWIAWIPLVAVVLVAVGFFGGMWVQARRGSVASAAASAPDFRKFVAQPVSAARGSQALSVSDWSAGLVRRHWKLAVIGRLTGVWQSATGWVQERIANLRNRIANRLVLAVPPSWRFRRWLRDSAGQTDQDALFRTIHARARRAGWLRSGQSLKNLGERLVSFPASKQRELRKLLSELETARYRGESVDLVQWRRSVERCLGGFSSLAGGLRQGMSNQPAAPSGLPPLNPSLSLFSDRNLSQSRASRI